MQFKVTKQYGRGSETLCQYFNDSAKANAYMQQQAESDASMKVNVVYRLYDDLDMVLKTLDTSKLDVSDTSSSATGTSSGGIQSSVSFKPTPFETSPRPKGTAPHWMKDEGDKKDEENK